MSKYKHLYFDLDRTLWDFETNSKETFRDIFKKYDLDKVFGDFDTFYLTYRKHNEQLWKQYREAKITKEKLRSHRFYLTLQEYGIEDDELAKKIGTDYITMSPQKTTLFPHTHETLAYLKNKGYNMYIITNGFEEVQHTKLRNCDLEKYFSHIITSEMAGCQKPKKEIFEYALSSVNAKKAESIMIGDDLEVDIKGAKGIGMDQVHFNFVKQEHNFPATYKIECLKELEEIF